MGTAHVLINCNPGFEKNIVSELEKFDSIHEARAVYGAFDIIAKLESPNLQELKENVVEDIRKLKNVISTLTLMNIDDY